MRPVPSRRVRATQEFDHRRLADLESRTQPGVERPPHANRLAGRRIDGMSGSREGRFELSRDDDRRTALWDKVKIEARAANANPAHRSLDDDEMSVASPDRLGVGGENDLPGISPLRNMMRNVDHDHARQPSHNKRN